jgi:AAHS family 4-hydroxybenzoate transporter-like MFS transporter
MKTVDVGELLDEGEWSGYQKLLIFAAALTIVLDGVDNQLLSVALPELTAQWHKTRPEFTPIVAIGLFGMMVGGYIGGVLGDRIGRRKSLIASVFIFGIMTVAVALFAHDLFSLGLLRFIAGLGLGGAMPNGTALASEYVPHRYRPFAVTLALVCIPFGGTVAGLVGAEVLPTLGWRYVFGIGGVLPLVLGLILIPTLPESPRFLARHRERWGDLRALLARLGHVLPADAEFLDRKETAKKATIGEILSPDFRLDTLALCASFFFCLMAAYAGVMWLPSQLVGIGYTPGHAGYGLTAFNVGGVVGALCAVPLVSRFGSRVTMLGMSASAVVGAVVVSLMRMQEQPFAVGLLLFFWTGGWINATQTLMYALAANVYPAPVRATGVGTAVAFGRIGSVISAYAGTYANSLPQLFRILAVTMSLVFISLSLVRRHVPRLASTAAGDRAQVAGR